MCLRLRRGREKSLLKTEKKIQELQEYLSLTTFNGGNSFVLDTRLKGQPHEVYIGAKMILIQLKLQQSNQHRFRERRKSESNPNWKQNLKKKLPDPDISQLGWSISWLYQIISRLL